MSDWKALGGRLTLFPGPSSVELPTVLSLYKKVWGDDPSNLQSPPNPLMPSVAEGRMAGLGNGCSVHPSRIDINFFPLRGENTPPKLTPIEDSKVLHDELERVALLVKQELVANPIVRIATHLQFVSVEATFADANRALTSIMPKQYRVALKDEEEFQLQVNRPRLSDQIKDQKMNFITKWSAENYQLLSVSVPSTGTGASPPNVAQQLTGFIAASVSFDYNNDPVPNDKPLTSAQQSALLVETIWETQKSLQECGLTMRGFANGQPQH